MPPEAPDSFHSWSTEVKTIKNIAHLVLIGCLSIPLVAFAVPAEDRNDRIEGIFSLQEWLSQAEASWQISFPYTTNAGLPGRIESELRYKQIDSPLSIITGGGNLAAGISFDITYGYGEIAGGHSADTDRFLSFSGGGGDFSQSTSRLRGDVRLGGGNVYFNSGRFGNSHAGPWGFVLGVFHYEDRLRMTQGEQTLSVPFDGAVFPPPGPFPASAVLNSTYDFSWNLLKAGISRQGELAKGFSYSGALSVFPYVDYRGEGYWNLRAGTAAGDFRLQSPNFIQTSQKGYGYDASLGLGYAVSGYMKLLAGYRYLYLYADGGIDTTYFADGSAIQSTLDWVTLARQGAYAEVLFQF